MEMIKITSSRTPFLMTRDKILRYLLVHQTDSGGCTVKELAEELDLTTNGVRQQLGILEKENLVVIKEKKTEIGRPAYAYALHENAMEYFPKIYADFSSQLLDEVTSRYDT
ncbi:MAG: helix-turn-helix transcriptional regulator, partial [Candidatus Odinarchaeota archaeon]